MRPHGGTGRARVGSVPGWEDQPGGRHRARPGRRGPGRGRTRQAVSRRRARAGAVPGCRTGPPAPRRAGSVGGVEPYAAIVLAGGAGRRLGGPGKPSVAVAGRPMVQRVLDAVHDAAPRVVVGAPGLPVPPGVVCTRERPSGGGPVAGAAAGLAAVPAGQPVVALLAADLPLLDPGAVATLRAALAGGADAALFVAADGWPQRLCGVWRRAALAAALRRVAGPARPGAGRWDGVAVRALWAAVPAVAEVPPPGGPAPWYDCDTPRQVREAERWLPRR